MLTDRSFMVMAVAAACIAGLSIMAEAGVFQPDQVVRVDTLYQPDTVRVQVPLPAGGTRVDTVVLEAPAQACPWTLWLPDGTEVYATHVGFDRDDRPFLPTPGYEEAQGSKYMDGYIACGDDRITYLGQPTKIQYQYDGPVWVED